jgi:hypothetical protein
LAVCWETLLTEIRQSAGNLLDLNLLGIFRDYTPELVSNLNTVADLRKKSVNDSTLYSLLYFTNTLIISEKKNKKSNLKDNFSYYLSGLIEGDGTIYVPKETTERNKNNKLNYPSIQIVFHLKDLPLALLIQKTLRHGSLSRKKGKNAYILTINNLEGLKLVVNLLNGKMRSNKIHVFHDLID